MSLEPIAQHVPVYRHLGPFAFSEQTFDPFEIEIIALELAAQITIEDNFNGGFQGFVCGDMQVREKAHERRVAVREDAVSVINFVASRREDLVEGLALLLAT